MIVLDREIMMLWLRAGYGETGAGAKLCKIQGGGGGCRGSQDLTKRGGGGGGGVAIIIYF